MALSNLTIIIPEADMATENAWFKANIDKEGGEFTFTNVFTLDALNYSIASGAFDEELSALIDSHFTNVYEGDLTIDGTDVYSGETLIANTLFADPDYYVDEDGSLFLTEQGDTYYVHTPIIQTGESDVLILDDVDDTIKRAVQGTVPVTKGDDGDKGIPGEKGETGDTGLTGDKGATGDKGEIGIKGDTGDTGPIGDKGLTGDKGVTGEKGYTGLKGPAGHDSEVKGATGDQGAQGETGVKGEDGDKGLTGEQGTVGPDGDQGLKGADGVKGQTGDTGIPGLKGATGDKGADGDRGLTGESGTPGSNGVAGDDGVGMPAGGTTGQILTKKSNTNYDTEWR